MLLSITQIVRSCRRVADPYPGNRRLPRLPIPRPPSNQRPSSLSPPPAALPRRGRESPDVVGAGLHTLATPDGFDTAAEC